MSAKQANCTIIQCRNPYLWIINTGLCPVVLELTKKHIISFVSLCLIHTYMNVLWIDNWCLPIQHTLYCWTFNKQCKSNLLMYKACSWNCLPIELALLTLHIFTNYIFSGIINTYSLITVSSLEPSHSVEIGRKALGFIPIVWKIFFHMVFA